MVCHVAFLGVGSYGMVEGKVGCSLLVCCSITRTDEKEKRRKQEIQGRRDEEWITTELGRDLS